MKRYRLAQYNPTSSVAELRVANMKVLIAAKEYVENVKTGYRGCMRSGSGKKLKEALKTFEDQECGFFEEVADE